MAKKRFCIRGHDTEAVGRDRWSYCRACSGLRKRSLEYLTVSRAYDLRRRDDPARREYRRLFDAARRQLPARQQANQRSHFRENLRRMAFRVTHAIGQLPPTLWGLFR